MFWIFYEVDTARTDPTRPSSVRPWRSLTAYISNSIVDTDIKFRHNLDLIFLIGYFLQLISYTHFSIVEISAILFSSFFITFDWMGISNYDGSIGNFSFWSFIINTLLISKYTFITIKLNFFGENLIFFYNFVAVLLKLLAKYRYSVNSDNCIGKVSSISIS